MKEADVKLVKNRSDRDKARSDFLELEQRVKMDLRNREKQATKPDPVRSRASEQSTSPLNPTLNEKEQMINQLIKYQKNFDTLTEVTHGLDYKVSSLAAATDLKP